MVSGGGKKYLYGYVGLALIGVFAIGCHHTVNDHEWAGQFEEVSSPSSVGASVPSLSVGGDQKIYMIWVEPVSANVNRLKFSQWDGKNWFSPRTIAEGSEILAGVSGEPKLMALEDGSLAAAWMTTAKKAKDRDATSLLVSFSRDEGTTWSPPTAPSNDPTEGEHEYAGLYEIDGQFGMAWLDPRRAVQTTDQKISTTEPPATILLATTFTKDGIRGKEVMLGNSVCDCCPISTTRTERGPVIVYRNRDRDGTRDIYLTRYEPGGWFGGHPVHRDEWKINGCPTNTAHSDALGNQLVTAWFTGVGEAPRVKLAFSSDHGDHFQDPVVVDEDQPLGHVSVVMLGHDRALVSWIGHSSSGRILYVQQIKATGERGPRQTVQPSLASAQMGFPALAHNGRDVLLAWTDSQAKRIRVVRAGVPRAER